MYEKEQHVWHRRKILITNRRLGSNFPVFIIRVFYDKLLRRCSRVKLAKKCWKKRSSYTLNWTFILMMFIFSRLPIFLPIRKIFSSPRYFLMRCYSLFEYFFPLFVFADSLFFLHSVKILFCIRVLTQIQFKLGLGFLETRNFNSRT